MIQVNHLEKSFEGFHALKGVDMHVEKGAIYGLVGPNGAGKSTLIRHITGVYKPDAGEVLIAGKPVYENKKVKAKFSYIPDEIFYFMQADTMEMKRFYQGIYPAFDEKLFYRMQEFFPNIDVKRSIRRLSKGMQKQVAFWLAICAKPELMILDEPVDGLDPVMRQGIKSILANEIDERKFTPIIASHNLRELEDVCDHVGLLHKGGVLLSKDLETMKCNIQKVQCALPKEDDKKLEKMFDILQFNRRGKLVTMTVRGSEKQVMAKLSVLKPVFYECIPLSLEEIFISETEVVGYDIKNLIL